MRELTAAERKAYDKMILGSKQISLTDIIKTEISGPEKSADENFPENDSKIIYSQMELFK